MSVNLLASKTIPLSRLLGALALLVSILGGYGLLLHAKWQLLEEALAGNSAGHAAQHLLLIPLLPITAVVAMALVIPLFVYVGNYAAFASLALPRPDHYVQLLFRVYRQWLSAGGKLKDKDL